MVAVTFGVGVVVSLVVVERLCSQRRPPFIALKERYHS